ncbi:hypothetical protein E4U54_007940 [Claviceps lovelessii]|nr:hypothetical protein E4U54_007940 [Claviceps lovelessii]
MRFSAALLSIFVALAAARGHKECACHSYTDAQGWHYDWELTKWTCLHDFQGRATYDHGSGRCIAHPRAQIDGDRFETDCIQNGVKDGYRRYNHDGSVNSYGPPILVGGAYSMCQRP